METEIFEQFRSAAGLQDASAPKQVSTLLYCLGEEAESVLNSMNISEDDRKDYAAVLAKFDKFFFNQGLMDCSCLPPPAHKWPVLDKPGLS